MTRRPSRRSVLSLLLGTAALLGLLDAADFVPIGKVRSSALVIGRPAASVLSAISRPIVASWNGVVHYDDVEEENYVLRRRVAELEGQSLKSQAVRDELAAVLEASNISYIGDLETVAARVVTDRVTASGRIVEIDKGSNHGLRERMPVVTGSGLIGHVGVVSAHRSTVRLLTSSDVAVGIRSNQGLGLTVGEAKNGGRQPRRTGDDETSQVAGPMLDSAEDSSPLVAMTTPGLRPELQVRQRHGSVAIAVELSPELKLRYEAGELNDGILFATSGLNNSYYPPGIPVGNLQSGHDKPTIESAADLTQINYLSILLTEQQS